MRKSIREQLIDLLRKNESVSNSLGSNTSNELKRPGNLHAKTLGASLCEIPRGKSGSQYVDLDSSMSVDTASLSSSIGTNLSIRERLIAQGVIKPAVAGTHVILKKAKEKIDVANASARKTTQRCERSSVLDMSVLERNLSVRGAVDGVDYLAVVGGLRDEAGFGYSKDAKVEQASSKANSVHERVKERNGLKSSSKNIEHKSQSPSLYFSRNYFKCSLCGKWIPLGHGLKHEAKHEGRDYVPLADVRPQSMRHVETTPVRNNRWVHVFQGGLPGLGKRSR